MAKEKEVKEKDPFAALNEKYAHYYNDNFLKIFSIRIDNLKNK